MKNSWQVFRVRSALAILLFALLSVCACATSGDTLADAREALRRQEYERAVVLFAAAERNGSLDYLTKQEAEVALRRAVDQRLARARTAEFQGDFPGALAELRAAQEFARNDERVAREYDRITREEDRVQRDLARAKALLGSGRPGEAHGILEPLGGKGRVSGEYDTLLRQSESAAERQVATARETERLRRINAVVSAAERDWRAGNQGAALAAIEQGRRDLGDDPAFADRARPWRDAVRTHFLELAAREEAADRFATALLLANAALVVDPEHRDARIGVERYARAARPVLTATVRVAEFSDETGGRVDPLRLQRTLLAALAHPFTEFTSSASGGSVDLAVYGTLKALEIRASAPTIENRVFDYVVRTEQEVNPERHRAERRVRAAEQRVADRERTLQSVRAELRELEALQGRAAVNASGTRRFGPYNQAAYYRLLADGQTRESQAKRSTEAAEEEREIAERTLAGIPYYLDRRIIGRVPYTVTTITKTGTATAFYAVSTAGRETEGRNPSGTETVRVTVSDSSHEGLPTAGLKADPLSIPDDVELSELALGDLVERLATRIQAGIDRKRLTLLEEGRTLMRKGEEPAALDRYAAFLLTTGDSLPLERATAARPIQAAFGVEVTASGIGLTGLRIDELGTD